MHVIMKDTVNNFIKAGYDVADILRGLFPYDTNLTDSMIEIQLGISPEVFRSILNRSDVLLGCEIDTIKTKLSRSVLGRTMVSIETELDSGLVVDLAKAVCLRSTKETAEVIRNELVTAINNAIQ